MKILTGIDVPFQPFGGSLICCDNWYSDLPDDVQVKFLAMPPPAGVTQWWQTKDVQFLQTPKVRGEAGFDKYVTDLRAEIAPIIAAYAPDVIHCQHLNYGLSRAIADLDLDIPCIGICHGTDTQAASGSDFFLQNMRTICDAMDMLIFPNQLMADDFFALYGHDASYAINPLGIPDKYYGHATQPVYDRTGPLRVVYAGRLLSWKGADIAVQAMSQITAAGNLTVIGNEDQTGYLQMMQDYVASHHLGDRVTFRPQLSRDDLIRAFSNYDVAVFPSTQLEAFSLTVVEAQAAGLPIVYGPAGGIEATAGGAGVRLERSTPEVLARALDKLAEHPKQLHELQQQGLKNAEHYRITASKQRLFELSKQLVNAA